MKNRIFTMLAATALHLLGYQNSDIGPFWPEDYMSKASDLGLLDGANRVADSPMTRGEAALLLYNLLGKNTAQGKAFYQGLAATTVTNAVLTDNTEITVCANNALTDYTAVNALPAALVGERGTLLLDSAGRAVGFLPDDNVRKTVTVTDADELNGVAIPNTTTVVLDDERTTWQESWYDLRRGDEVVVYYSVAGTIDLLWVKTRAAAAGSTVTGCYEDASPNTTAPGTITVLGAALSVTDEGRAALKGYSIGDKITVTLDESGKVIGVAAASATQMVEVLVLNDVTGAAYTYGILVKGEKQGGSGTMTYTNNTVSVENSAGQSTAYVTGISFKDESVGGVAYNAEGKAAAIVTLTAKTGLARADFDGSEKVANMPLAEDLQAYNTAADKRVSLSAAKAFTDSFTAYYDAHGVVRVIFAE